MSFDNDVPATDIDDQLRVWADWARSSAPNVAVPNLGEMGPRPGRLGRFTNPRPILAAVCVLALIVGMAVYLAHRADRTRAASSPPSCPVSQQMSVAQRLSNWVPTSPGVNTAGQLLPEQTPDSAVICSYGRGSGRRVLSGSLAALAQDLHSVDAPPTGSAPSRICAEYDAPLTDNQAFLLGARYGTATVWVAMPGNHCLGASNGAGLATQNLRADAQQAFETGIWDTDPRATQTCTYPSSAGSSQTDALVHGRTITICLADRDQWRAYTYPGVTGRELIISLHNWPATIAPAGCQASVAQTPAMMLIVTNNDGTTERFAAANNCTNLHIGAHGAVDRLIDEIVVYEISRQ